MSPAWLPCPTCKGELVAAFVDAERRVPDPFAVRCSRCGRSYQNQDWARRIEREKPEEAAARVEVLDLEEGRA